MGFCQGGCCEFMDWFSEQHTFIFNGLVRRFCAAFLFCVLFNYVNKYDQLLSFIRASCAVIPFYYVGSIPEYHKLTLFLGLPQSHSTQFFHYLRVCVAGVRCTLLVKATFRLRS